MTHPFRNTHLTVVFTVLPCAPSQPLAAPPAQAPIVHDFDGDGTDDVLILGPNTLTLLLVRREIDDLARVAALVVVAVVVAAMYVSQQSTAPLPAPQRELSKHRRLRVDSSFGSSASSASSDAGDLQ